MTPNWNQRVARIRKAVLLALEIACAAALWIIVALLAGGGLERNLIGTAYIGNIDDLIAFFMATLFMVGLSIALARGGHVRVDLLYRLYPERLRALADLVFKAFGVLAGIGLTAAGLALAFDSYRSGRMYYGLVDMPLFILQLVIALGGAAFTLEFVFGVEEPDNQETPQ